MPKQVTVTLTLPDGKRKYFRGATRKEAERKREEAKRSIDAGLDISAAKTTVKDFAEMWLKEYKRGTVRDVTYMSLESIVNRHILPSIGRMKVVEVRPVHIQKLIRDQSHLAKSTQQRIITTLRALFEVAIENSLILKNPCVKSVKAIGEQAEEKMPLTKEQEKALLDKARGTKLYLFVLLGLNCGLRRGELLGLQWGDIDFDTGMLNVERSIAPTKERNGGEVNTDLKTKAAKRTIPLPWSVVEELRAERSRAESVYVVHNRGNNYMGLTDMSYHWENIVKDLPFYVTPHIMRHTRITRWFEQGLDVKEVQYLAGHSNTKMTLDVYTHYQKESRLCNTAEKIRAAM